MGEFPFASSDEVQFKGPTLFVRGLRSHYVTDAVLPFVSGFFPGFELRDLDCGHWVISERRDEFRQGDNFFSPATMVRANINSCCGILF